MHISVALCTYNGSRYLPEQLASIAGQTRQPDEIVVCDDGSQDATLDLLRDFARQSPFPVHIHVNPQNLGSNDNFAQAISLCEGTIIVLSDQDDIWKPDKLACVESAFSKAPALAGLFTDADLIDAEGRQTGRRLWETIGFGRRKQARFRNGKGMGLLLQGNVVTGATLSFRADWKDLLLPIPPGWIHDHWIALLLASATRLDLTEQALIYYRCHPAQQLGVRESGRRRRSLAECWQRLAELDAGAYLAAAAKAELVAGRLLRYGLPETCRGVVKCRAMAQHFRVRASLPRSFLRRLPRVLGQLVTGAYFRHSLGMKSLLRDLIAGS